MNRKILALNIGLLVLFGTLGWMLRAHWREARSQHRATLAKAARPSALLPPPSPTPPEPAVPANYLEVAQKTLFSRDRNPNVIIETAPPPPPKAEEPTPPRPAYYGQMGIGEPVAFLSAEKGGQRGFHVGDEVGPFKLVAFNRETITFEWHDKTLEYPLAELKPKEGTPAAAAAQSGVPTFAPSKPASAGPVIGITEEKGPVLGTQNGEIRSCVAGDKSPSGTVKDGFKKSVVPGPFGPMCQWEPIK
ncbi:MAG: hypothetical protein JWO19_1798 [Bryobacterales bacterium]|nr:hypothetical protein [Bryobacterales bacterium]